MYQTRHSGASIVHMWAFNTLQEVRERSQWHHSPSLARSETINLETTRATCRGAVNKATAGPAVHKRMIGSYLLDFFGRSCFLAKTGAAYVFDTKLGPRYDVTKPLVRTIIRQDVSAGKCRRNVFTSTTTRFMLSQSDFRLRGHRKHASSCSLDVDSGTPVVGRRAENPDSCGPASHGLGPRGFLRFWIFTRRVLVFTCQTLTMNAKDFQRTHLLSGMGSSRNSSKDIGMGVTDFALACGSEPVMDSVCTAVVDLPMYATSATHDSQSLKKGDNIHHLCRIV